MALKPPEAVAPLIRRPTNPTASSPFPAPAQNSVGTKEVNPHSVRMGAISRGGQVTWASRGDAAAARGSTQCASAISLYKKTGQKCLVFCIRRRYESREQRRKTRTAGNESSGKMRMKTESSHLPQKNPVGSSEGNGLHPSRLRCVTFLREAGFGKFSQNTEWAERRLLP